MPDLITRGVVDSAGAESSRQEASMDGRWRIFETDSGERKQIAVTKVFCYVLCDQIDRNV
jgi:hypothetical protein